MICGSELREKIRRAIIEKYDEDPQDRFRILRNPREKDGIYEVQVQWDKYDLEVLSVRMDTEPEEEYSEEYPLGGMIEPYDIEKEKELTEKN